jgi:pilus assembly protein FimV
MHTQAGWKLSAMALACLVAGQAQALGLGRLNVQSALGETLRAEIEVTSITAEEASSLRLRVAPPEAYRAQGVEYNPALAGAQVSAVRRPDGRTVLRVTSERAVLEPFVDVIIEASWATGRLVREYTLLFDPPSTRTAQAPAPAAAPVISPTPAPAAAAPAPAPTPTAAAPAPRAPRTAAAAPAARREFSGDEYRVRSGDTLSRIAGRTQRQGVSLDQMLVSLFRTNPEAFMGSNMNRLRSGAVLTVPSAEEVGKTTAQEARELIVAQSADFAAYRQRLAAGTTTAADTAPARQATGRVQTQVEERRAAAASPDKLTLSQGGVKAGAEAKTSQATERKDSNTRLAELNRNVEELKKLQGQTAASPAGTPAPAAPATPPAPAPAPAPASAPAAVTPPPAPAPVPAPAPAPAPPLTAATPTPAPAAPPVAAPPPPPAPAPAPVAAAPKPPAAPPAAEKGFIDSLLDNPALLPGAGVLVALLAGLGVWRMRSRRKQGGETSFLESRLQPDSFFGASGGQRIDTREAPSSQNSSSMSYSLSQLDAIGDVDPVAEADVYLAYGRDLQAEEILKEAMRANPERMAIRSKLLEVYAKRRDIKGFELLATQMHNLTRGEGEDWAKAQALGLSIDPDNPLYQPGGKPETVIGSSGQPVEALGASTVPYTAPVAPPSFQPAPDATLDGGGGVDLDLDFEPATVPVKAKPAPSDATIPLRTPVAAAAATAAGAAVAAPAAGLADINFDLETPTIKDDRKKPAVAPAPADDGLDFDLGDLNLDDSRTTTAPVPPSSQFGEFSIGSESIPSASMPLEGDPLARKLELAEEFRQIGDLEGARDLLEEVVAKADGPLRNKAQSMLDRLG